MIGCDKCDDWYHWLCVGITSEPAENTDWYCPRCVLKNLKISKKDKDKTPGKRGRPPKRWIRKKFRQYKKRDYFGAQKKIPVSEEFVLIFCLGIRVHMILLSLFSRKYCKRIKYLVSSENRMTLLFVSMFFYKNIVGYIKATFYIYFRSVL